jgi:nitrate/nitrite-specific signal transduction histidine kinase
MAVPWLVVGRLVLNNLDTIIGVVKPAFTRKKADTLPTQTDLLNQQIAELQTAASSNAEQIATLAAQVRELVVALEQATADALVQRVATRRFALAALGVSVVATLLAITSFVVH